MRGGTGSEHVGRGSRINRKQARWYEEDVCGKTQKPSSATTIAINNCHDFVQGIHEHSSHATMQHAAMCVCVCASGEVTIRPRLQ